MLACHLLYETHPNPPPDPMTKIHLPLRLLLASCALFLLLSEALAGSAASEAHGAIVWKLTAASTTEAGSSLTLKPVFRGLIREVSGSIVSVSGSPFIAGALAIPSSPHALRLTSGSQKGRLFRIQQNSVNSATLDATGLALDDAGLKVKAGDRIEILPLATLDSRFGQTSATVKIQAGANEQTADLVQIWNGSTWDNYFFSTGVTPARWVPAANPSANAGDLVLSPDTALKIVRRGVGKQLVLNGRVPPVRTLFRAVEGSDTSLGAPYPVPIPVAELFLGGPAVWGRSGSPASADKVRLAHNGSDLTLFQDTAGVWRNVASSAVNLIGVGLQPAGMLWVQNVGAMSAAPWFTLNAPYPDQVGPIELPVEPPVVVRPPQPVPPSLRISGGTNVTTKSKSRMVRGSASSSQSQISRVEYRLHPSKTYRAASGASGWSFKAKLREGKNIFYVRAIDNRGMASPAAKVTIKRK